VWGGWSRRVGLGRDSGSDGKLLGFGLDDLIVAGVLRRAVHWRHRAVVAAHGADCRLWALGRGRSLMCGGP
jgi:hypothetical protein